MQHLKSSEEISFVPEHSSGTKQIWKVFWLLLVITVVEVSIGLSMYLIGFPSWLNAFLKGIIIILGLAKVFYIIAEFMHLGTELKNLVFTLIFPILFLIWLLVALLAEGSSFLAYKDRYDVRYRQDVVQKYQNTSKQDHTPPSGH